MQSLQPFITPNSERRDTMFGLPETSVTSAHSPDSSIAKGISFILSAVPNLVEIVSANYEKSAKYCQGTDEIGFEFWVLSYEFDV